MSATGEVCPDCGRPKAGGTEAPMLGGIGGCGAHLRNAEPFGFVEDCKDFTIARLRAELEALKDPAVWVATSERMPEPMALVLFITVANRSIVRVGGWDGERFVTYDNGRWWPKEVAYWMPRNQPAPPKETDDAEG